MDIAGVQGGSHVHTADGLVPLHQLRPGYDNVFCYYGKGVIGAQRLMELIEHKVPATSVYRITMDLLGHPEALRYLKMTERMRVAAFPLPRGEAPFSLRRADFVEARTLRPEHVVVALEPRSVAAFTRAKVKHVQLEVTLDPYDMVSVYQLKFLNTTPYFCNGILVSEGEFNG